MTDTASPGSPDTLASSAFTLWAVLRRDPEHPVPSDASPDELDAAVRDLGTAGVTVRGFYDVSGLRADADVIVWLYGESAEALQQGIRRLRQTALLASLLPVWNAMGVHRGAEFNPEHAPAFMRGLEPRGWLAVYPFVRGYDWYVLDPADRSRMLAEHGRRGAAYTSVLSNTVSAFALGDYEWIVPLESDVLTDIVDLMRDLRGVNARLHVREEIPFYTGRRIGTAELAEVLR